MKLYDELLWRGLIKDVSNEEKARQLLNDEKKKTRDNWWQWSL